MKIQIKSMKKHENPKKINEKNMKIHRKSLKNKEIQTESMQKHEKPEKIDGKA